MKKGPFLRPVGLVLFALLGACGWSDGRPDAVATMSAECVAATMTAGADQFVITLVVASPPAVEPTANLMPTTVLTTAPSSTSGSKAMVIALVKIGLATDGSGDYATLEDTLPIVLGDIIELPLRNKPVESAETYLVTTRVIASDETESEAATVLVGAEDTILVCPDDSGATTEGRGTYTVIWEIDGGLIASGGVEVGGGASW